jgi:hypothetical protein
MFLPFSMRLRNTTPAEASRRSFVSWYVAVKLREPFDSLTDTI